MESSQVAAYQLKIGQLLQKFVEPDCYPMHETSLNRLYTLVAENETNGSGIIDLAAFTQFLQRCLQTFDESPARPEITAFILKLISILSRDESKFNALNHGASLVRLLGVMGCRSNDAPPAVKMAYLRVVSACMAHNSGLEWIFKHAVWEDVLKFALTNQTLYVKRESTVCFAVLLEKTVEEAHCDAVMKRITAPLYAIGDNYDFLKPTFQLISDILDHNMEHVLCKGGDSRVVKLFLRETNLVALVDEMFVKTENSPVHYETSRLLLLVLCMQFYLGMVSGDLTDASASALGKKILGLFTVKNLNSNMDQILKLTEIGQYYGDLLLDKVPHTTTKCSDRDGKPFLFSQQLMVFYIMPIFAVSYRYYSKKLRGPEHEMVVDLRDEFAHKSFKMLCENTVRMLFQWRDNLWPHPNLFENATKAITYLIRSSRHYGRERGCSAFQSCLYVFKDCIETIKMYPENFGVFNAQPAFLCMLMEAHLVLIEKFTITWRDSLESICILGMTFDFISLGDWSTQVVVQAMKLINVAIAKYMTPSMALLVDSSDGVLVHVGPLLYKRLHDSEWAVRDSTLEVLCTIASMSNIKFPSFQKILLSCEFPDLIVKMATDDGESYVRASAIKCLHELIGVEDVWTKSLKKHNLWETMSKVLLTETEGVVRVEAATFLCIAYKHQQLPAEALDGIYDLMIHATTVDLYWEVKVRALQFWDNVIKTFLQHEGMVDGTFPQVTFSTENRKIVTLTHAEIRKRLFKVVEKLSRIGCLGALISAVQDDCDVEVTKSAVDVLTPLVNQFALYDLYKHRGSLVPTLPNGVSSSSTTSSSGISVDDSMTGSPCNASHCDYNTCADNYTGTNNSDDIIEQIISSRDVTLLTNIYNTPTGTNGGGSSDCDSVSNYEIQVKKIVSPQDFIQFTRQDLQGLVSDKQHWLSQLDSLDSLLDDMLKTYRDDTNNMDCY